MLVRLTLILFCLLTPLSNAIAQSPFIEAVNAVRHGDQLAVAEYLNQLDDPDLATSLHFHYLKKFHDRVPESEVADFLTRYATHPYGKQLRRSWLRHLAKQKDWGRYRRYYLASNNVTLQCWYLQALSQTGDQARAFKGVEKLWLVGHSQPETCSPIFKAWQQQGHRTRAHLHLRLTLAMAAENFKLARYLISQLPTADQAHANFWLARVKNPFLLKRTSLNKLTKDPERLSLVLQRLADKNAARAAEQWTRLSTHVAFTDTHRGKILREIALQKAFRNHEDALAWFNAAGTVPQDTLFYEWATRAALLQKNWTAVKKNIEQLPHPIQNKPCWQYWLATSLKNLGDKKGAEKIYVTLAKQRHYYGFLASETLGIEYQLHHAQLPVNLIEHVRMITHPELLQAKYFYHNKKRLSATRHWRLLQQQLTPKEKYISAKLASSWGWHDQAIFTLRHADFQHDLKLRFPLAHKAAIKKLAAQHRVPPALLFALIRQESSFMSTARSPSGAYGLMQLLPTTAKIYAKRARIKTRHSGWLLNVSNNLTLGVRHLRAIFKKFKDHPLPTLAAYNAGENKVKFWLKQRPLNDPTIWIETIPWHETRNYVKNILTYTMIYEQHLGKRPSLKKFLFP